MIIDSHTHIGFNETLSGKTETLVQALRDGGVDKALVFAGNLNECSVDRLLAEIAPYEGMLYAIGSVTPGERPSYTVEQVEAWLASGAIRGLKFYCGYEYFYPADASVRPYLELCAKYGRPAIFHSGDLYNKAVGAKLKYAHPLHIDDLASEMPTLQIVIAHLGSPWLIDAAEVCYKNANVYSDCSGFVYGTFDKQREGEFVAAAAEFMRVAEGSEKILFGSDWPIAEPGSYAAAARAAFGAGAEHVFSGNAKRLFGIE